jgi:hypothetical protein
VRYRLSADGRVAFRVERLRGRRAPRVVGRFTHAGRAGENAFVFTGRIGGRALRPGRYRLVATAGGVTRRVVFSVRR